MPSYRADSLIRTGGIMSDLVNELAVTTPWDREMAKAVVDGCTQRGLSEEQTRSFCRLALESGLKVGALWSAMDTLSAIRGSR